MSSHEIESTPGTRPVRQLFLLADQALSHGDIAASRKLLLQACQLDCTGEACRRLGNLFWRESRFADALNSFEAGLKLAREMGTPQVIATCAHDLATLCRELLQRDDARRWQQVSLETELRRASTGSQPDWATELAQWALDELLSGKHRRARRLFITALLLERQRGNPAGEASDWGNLGNVAAVRGQFERAIRCYRKAIRLHKELADPHGLGCDHQNLGELYLHSGEALQGCRHLRRAANLFDEAGWPGLAKKARRRAKRAL